MKKVLYIILACILIAGVVYFYQHREKEAVFNPVTTSYAIGGDTYKYFGNEAKGDLDGDGTDDLAYLITKDNAGSGVFYYAIVALNTADGYKLTNPFFIGDRIAPQSTYIPKNSMEVQVNYADRKPGEPMTAKPTVGATKVLKVTSMGVLEGVMK